jgi:predicted lipoprotein
MGRLESRYRFGPAGDSSTPFGAGIGDEIYSWVVSTNPCRVDQETAAADHADPVAATAKPINVRGLDALEYLLFAPDPSNRCSAGLSINADGTWLAIEGELAQRRASQAHALAIDVHERARALVAAWEPVGGDFSARLVDGRAYADTGEAFGAVVGATLYLDTQTKDRKVGIPSG